VSLAVPPLETVCSPPLDIVVEEAIPALRTSIVSPALSVMPVLVVFETTKSVIQSPKILVIQPRAAWRGLFLTLMRASAVTNFGIGRYPLAPAAHKRENAANAWQSLTMVDRGFRVR
jgi:hypothetical protein